MPLGPIGPNDYITVEGNKLYDSHGDRFFMKGIAFPISPEPAIYGYNSTGWINVLDQLQELGLEFNTIRLYKMDPSIDYSLFFDAAAEMGVYILVPLTGYHGDGDLDRDVPPLTCYKPELYGYGVRSINNYKRFPNVLGGVIGNEVMNNEITWQSAPCVKAYTRDLKKYVTKHVNRPFPLIYTAQHGGIGAYSPTKVLEHTLDYLTCDPTPTDNDEENDGLDMFGVNIESWCNPNDTFEHTVGSYKEVWEGLHDSPIPLFFSEMGCPQNLYKHEESEGYGRRQWNQIDVVLNEMSDTWSGFSAYAYEDGTGRVDGFNMFEGGVWDGFHTLEPNEDFFNFQKQMKNTDHEPVDGDYNITAYTSQTCDKVLNDLKQCCNIDLLDINMMPSHFEEFEAKKEMETFGYFFGIVFAIATLGFGYLKCKKSHPKTLDDTDDETEPHEQVALTTNKNDYKSVA
mmetsp:Transcript_11245/g.15823  ORF Transcript_11245/g.15823 Transcript_11245/m.15823 type:complete len:456 (+) Transcript_11245:40-1407(+)